LNHKLAQNEQSSLDIAVAIAGRRESGAIDSQCCCLQVLFISWPIGQKKYRKSSYFYQWMFTLKPETFGTAGSKAVVYYYALPTQLAAATCQISTL